MGEVYRARDTKLDRNVAVKVLPETFAKDSERIARFEREAKLLASLNHSNIADIPDGNPVSIENLLVHFCEKGNGYLVKERKFLMEAREGALVIKKIDVE